MIPPSFIQELLARVDIVEVVGRTVKLKKAGANYLGLCPFHNEKSPSFTVSATKQFYHCFGCGQHGTAISFLMEHSGLGFIDAVKDLAQQVGLTVPEPERTEATREQGVRDVDLFELMASVTRFYKQRLKESTRAIDYLKNRGVSGKTAARFAIGYAPDAWRSLEAVVPDYQHESLTLAGLVIDSARDDSLATETTTTESDSDGANGTARRKRFDRFRDRIMFPIRNPRGQVIGFGGRVLDKGEPKYMNSPETPLFSKGRELYGIYEGRETLRASNFAIVVEGYMDVVMLAQYGVSNAVATLGTATTPDHVQKLLRLVDRVVFAFDGDAAGRKAAWRALEACLPKVADTKRLDFLLLPAEHDPDSYVREHREEGFNDLLAGALPLSEFLLRELSARADTETPEGRALFLALARPLLLALPAVALRLQLLHRVAEVARVATNELTDYLRQSAQPMATGSADPLRAASSRSGNDPRRRADSRSAAGWRGGGRFGGVPLRISATPIPLAVKIRVLTAHHPVLAVGDIEPGFLSSELLDWLKFVAKLPPGSTFAVLSEALRSDKPNEAAQLAKEVADAPALADCSLEEASAEFKGALAKLRERGLEHEMALLSRSGLRTTEQRERYQFLLSVKSAEWYN